VGSPPNSHTTRRCRARQAAAACHLRALIPAGPSTLSLRLKSLQRIPCLLCKDRDEARPRPFFSFKLLYGFGGMRRTWPTKILSGSFSMGLLASKIRDISTRPVLRLGDLERVSPALRYTCPTGASFVHGQAVLHLANAGGIGPRPG